jgi:hypothetical protein
MYWIFLGSGNTQLQDVGSTTATSLGITRRLHVTNPVQTLHMVRKHYLHHIPPLVLSWLMLKGSDDVVTWIHGPTV